MTLESISHQEIAPPRTTSGAFRIMAVDDEEGVLAILEEHLKATRKLLSRPLRTTPTTL